MLPTTDPEYEGALVKKAPNTHSKKAKGADKGSANGQEGGVSGRKTGPGTASAVSPRHQGCEDQSICIAA